MNIKLPNVTLLGIDCVNAGRLSKALDISSERIEFAQVKLLTSLPVGDKRRVEISPLNSIEAFSEFCIRDLYKYVETDFVLLVQYDGFVINPESWEDNFLKYDYIGAPWLVDNWSIDNFDFPEKLYGHLVVGNGGFSLRSKKFLETSARLADEGALKKYHPEDVALCVWFRHLVESEGIKFAPPEVAARFSVEGDEHVYKKQFGFHGLQWEYIRDLVNRHPEWKIDLPIKKESWLNVDGEIKIAQAAVNDAISISEIQKEVWMETFPNEEFGITREDIMSEDFFNEQRIQKRMEVINNPDSAVKFWVAKRGKKVVGYICAERLSEFNRIRSIYILSQFQGKGLGTRLMNEAFKYFNNDNPIKLTVAIYNQSAITFYEKLGFVKGKRFDHNLEGHFVSGHEIPEMEMIKSNNTWNIRTYLKF
ncbi:MAG: GNAT family N-acetyltransferase [Candidatus Vogelbacteria bacterium]|nr:GNAT family N-acetyltransferase [Candidatus Vogelbacteria bacterium]